MAKSYRYLACISVFAAGVLALCLISVSEISYSVLDNRSSVLYDSTGRVIAYTLAEGDYLRFKTQKEDVSPLYLDLMLANEDQNFYSHCGVDILSLAKAFITNVQTGKISTGGSTIAMQVAKKLTGHKKRTYYNKIKEIICAVFLTLRFGHNKVLDMYLTLAPFGSNIEGVKAASLKWFGHLPDRMTPSEAALLAALPRAPEHIRPDRHLDNAFYYKNEVLKLARKHHVLTAYDADLALRDKIQDRQYRIDNFNLPILNELKRNNPEQREFFSSLDEYQMDILKEIAHNFEKTKDNEASLSAVIMDNRTRQITALLGSSDVKRTQLCLPYSPRSPGSALKPFVYAMAMNEGKLHPDTILHDKKSFLGTWSPNNFDRKFKGAVSAREALSNSLNLPAIEVLKLVGDSSFVSSINALDSRHGKLLKTKNGTTDLSITLGSGDISLVDLAKLYAMLNNDGMYYDFSLLLNDGNFDKNYSKRFVAKDAARAVFNILKSTPRPANASDFTKVSYKTGTSYKFNDALAIGSLENYTAAVAIRYVNNNASASRGGFYSGFNNAAPLLFEIFKKLKPAPYKKEKLDSPLLRDVPPALKENIDSKESKTDKNKLYIDFPTNDAVVTPNADMMVFINYHGGEGKVYLNVDDLQTDKNYFTADKEGFYKVVLFDEKGHSDTVTFKVVFR